MAVLAASRTLGREVDAKAHQALIERTLDEAGAALEAITTGQPKAIRSVLLLLEQRDRIALLSDIAREFSDLVDRRAGIVKAKITTAVPLDAKQQRELIGRLEKTSGHELKATFVV